MTTIKYRNVEVPVPDCARAGCSSPRYWLVDLGVQPKTGGILINYAYCMQHVYEIFRKHGVM